MSAWRVVAGLGLVVAGCQRSVPRPPDIDLPPLPDDPPTETDTADEDAAPRCALTEAEPNNALGEAGVLPWERRACGDFASAFDADFWTAELSEPAWVAFDLSGFSVGSEAWLSLTASLPEQGLSVGVSTFRSLPEAHLVLPSPAGAWLLMARQAITGGGGQGTGPDYFYELRASVTKPPLDWDVTEAERPGGGGQAQALTVGGDGVTVYGLLTAPGEADGYEVTVPAGQAVRVEVLAHGLGSPADVGLRVEPAGGPSWFQSAGPTGLEVDPAVVVPAGAGGRMRLELVEERGQGSPLMWYALRVAWEEGP